MSSGLYFRLAQFQEGAIWNRRDHFFVMKPTVAPAQTALVPPELSIRSRV